MQYEKIRAVLMDMDGTMYDTEALDLEGFLQAAKLYDIPFTREQILSFRGRKAEENALTFEEYGLGEAAMYFTLREFRVEYMQNYLAEHGVPEKPGLRELLDYLKESDLLTVVATGTDRSIAEGYWEQSGITSYIDCSVCGDEVTKSKPDPETFLLAAEKAGVPIEQCVILEDSPNGVKSALASGARVILIPDLSPATEEEKRECDFVVDTLSDVIPCLKTIEKSLCP
ncbi:MAG: HAD family phosphatase [Clostridia bacterium]|nr:HAD family phosphatase [Clostridia bacterium]